MSDDRPTVGSLFAGIGGIDLGLERAGFKTKWQVEIDDYARSILQKHFPDAERFRDVKQFPPEFRGPVWLGHNWRRRFAVDVIAGGFPCQDISNAGKQAGIEGERSGLWSEFKRIIRDLRPRFALLENVAALSVRGLDRVLGDLAEIGYSAEWRLLSAAEFGAPHIRKRLFIAAYPDRFGILLERGWFADAGRNRTVFVSRNGTLQQMAGSADTIGGGRDQGHEEKTGGGRCESGGSGQNSADTDGKRCAGPENDLRRKNVARGPARNVSDTESAGLEGRGDGSALAGSGSGKGHAWATGRAGRGWWSVEPDVGRMAYGVPARVDRLRGIGNAVVPQKAEFLGNLLMAALNKTESINV